MFVMMMLLTLAMLTQAHEAAHAETCKKFGGKVLGTDWNMQKMTIVTTCQIQKTDVYLAADSAVDSYGYQIQAEIFSILIIVHCLGWLILWISGTKNNVQIEGKRLRDE